MKMVSAAKLRRAQEAAVQARPYAEKMTELLKNVSARVSSEAHPLLHARDAKKIQIVLFTSDRGLCGGYNANLIRAAETFIRKNGVDKEIEITLVGRKGADHFRRRRAHRRSLYRHFGPVRSWRRNRQKLIRDLLTGNGRGLYSVQQFPLRAVTSALWKNFCPWHCRKVATARPAETEYLYEPGCKNSWRPLTES
jgi:ATP synthase F1 gamma subunit